MRAMILSNKEIFVETGTGRKNMIKSDTEMKKYDEDIQVIFKMLKQLINQPQPPRSRIGFKP